MELLAREITDAAADNEIYQLARRIAEAQIDLVRARQARHDFLIGLINNPHYIFEAAEMVAPENKTAAKTAKVTKKKR